MKKVIGLLALILLINSCDDGDVKVQNITFADIAASSSCGDIVYKINGKELLLIKISDIALLPYKNEVGVQSIPISSSTKVIYRNYNGVPTGENICSNPPAATPSVIEEWNAIGGTIEITTSAVITKDETTQATKIVKYNHSIIFKNIVFQKPQGTQTYDAFVFGDYATPTVLTYPFGTQFTLNKCDSNNIIYSQIGSEALNIDNIDPSLIANTETPTVRTMALGATTNVLSYKIYNNTIPPNFFCDTPMPTTPTLTEHWDPDYTATSGTIEVTTSVATSGPNTVYTHKIHLKNVTLKKVTGTETLSFYLGDDCYYGNLILQ